MDVFKKLTHQEQQEIFDYLLESFAYEEITVNDKIYFMVHVGLNDFDPEKTIDEYEVEDFVWARPNFEKTYFNDLQKYVIVGHTPTLAFANEAKIIHKNHFIMIDCGACYTQGKLACLCLNTMEEFYV